MSEPAALAAEAAPSPADAGVEDLVHQLGLSRETAAKLVAAGYPRAEAVRALDEATLQGAGLDAEEVRRVKTAAEAKAAAPPASDEAATKRRVDGEKIVERWMDSVRKVERPRRRTVSIPPKDSTEVLKRWVEGDDRAMEAWIHASETTRPPTRPPAAPDVAPPSPAPEAPVATPPVVAPAPVLPAQVLEREETVVRWLTNLLDRVKSDQFDPHSLLQEVQDLQRSLYEERTKRRQLEDEIEHVKRGSIAVIKYVRSREAKAREQAVQSKDAEIADLKLRLLQGGAAVGPNGELLDAPVAPPSAPMDDTQTRDFERRLREEFSQREQGYVDRETEMRRRTVQLEAEIRSLRSEAESLRGREDLLQQQTGSLSGSIQERMSTLDQRERDLIVRENELRSKFEEIKISSEEVERKRAPLAYKEKELASWEQQLQTHKQALELEARRLEKIRADVGSTEVSSTREKALDDLKNDVNRREEELRAREQFLRQKMEELEQMQLKAAEFEADQMHSDATAATHDTKVSSGVRRLDDLLYGGYAPGSQLLVNGPTHTGKDVLARLFVAEGLKQGVPAIWLVTDKTYTQIRDEMAVIFPPYPQFESRGMIRYLDMYSRSLGVTEADPTVRLLSPTEKGVTEQTATAANQFSQDLKQKFGSYRLVFESVSTLTAYLDTPTTFRFLQPFVGRRKLDGAAAYYILETGMHTDSDLQTLEHMMDGSVNLKVDQLKTFLSVKGIGETQSRAWIGYTFSKKSFSLGSFSLDHIR